MQKSSKSIFISCRNYKINTQNQRNNGIKNNLELKQFNELNANIKNLKHMAYTCLFSKHYMKQKHFI